MLEVAKCYLEEEIYCLEENKCYLEVNLRARKFTSKIIYGYNK